MTSAVGRSRADADRALRVGAAEIVANGQRTLDEDLDTFFVVTDEVIDVTETIGTDLLRSFDAIYRACAAQTADELTAVVTYDHRSSRAAATGDVRVFADRLAGTALDGSVRQFFEAAAQ
ncbi:MAG: hypothetical protein ACPGVY_13745 [Mycobacterium sp.]